MLAITAITLHIILASGDTTVFTAAIKPDSIVLQRRHFVPHTGSLTEPEVKNFSIAKVEDCSIKISPGAKYLLLYSNRAKRKEHIAIVLNSVTMAELGRINLDGASVSQPFWRDSENFCFESGDIKNRSLVVSIRNNSPLERSYKVAAPRAPSVKFAAEAARVVNKLGYRWFVSNHGPRLFTPKQFENKSGLAVVSEKFDKVAICAADKADQDRPLVLLLLRSNTKRRWEVVKLGHQRFPMFTLAGETVAMQFWDHGVSKVSVFSIPLRKTVLTLNAQSIDLGSR